LNNKNLGPSVNFAVALHYSIPFVTIKYNVSNLKVHLL